eukprot:gene7821-8631_t
MTSSNSSFYAWVPPLVLLFALIFVFTKFFRERRLSSPPSSSPPVPTEEVIFLYSNYSTTHVQADNTRRMEHILSSKGVLYKRVDGSDMEQKVQRDELFAVSHLRGKYPQCFIKGAEGIRFVGMWEELERLVECDGLTSEILETHPDIPTFSKVFQHVHRLPSLKERE